MLETKRILLRPPKNEDLDSIHSLYCDPDIQKYLGGSYCIEVSERHLQMAIQNYGRDGYGMMVIFEKEKNGLIGFCKIQSSPLESPNNIEIIYGLLPEWRGKGYAMEAVQEILHWFFDEFVIDRIIGRVKQDNTVSRKLLEKLGFVKIEDRIDLATNEIEYVFLITKQRYCENE